MAKGGRRGHLPPPPKGIRTSPDPYTIGGYKTQGTNAKDAKAYLHSGRIVHVDTETMVCSVAFDSMRGERQDIPLPAPGGSGPRSWAGIIPEVGTKVIIGWKKFDNRGNHTPYIIEFLTSGIFPAREYEPYSSVDPNEAAEILLDFPEYEDDPHANFGVTRLKARKGYPGDFIASSSSGSDFILDRDAFVTNRAGNEFRLRDSDQTSILNVRNEFVTNAAGYYRRGLIKRSALNLLPDLFPVNHVTGKPYAIINPGKEANGVDEDGDPLDRNPAYNILHNFGLIQNDGSPNFSVSTSPELLALLESNPELVSEFFGGSDALPGVLNYPYVVHPDGQRASYIVQGSATQGFNVTPVSYTEDRFEMRMIDDGVMKVTDEVDGFQIDPPYPVFIEDVRGTVVGNDFHTASGRSQYGRILGMKIFNSSKDKKVADNPVIDPLDVISRLEDVDFVGLARLFAIRHPTTSNQYVFGVTKEGRVMIHVPMAHHGEADDVGRSIDLNVVGMMKAIIGASPNHEHKSVDLKLEGGLELEIGRFASDPAVTDKSAKGGESVRIELHGGVTHIVHGDPITGLAYSGVMGGSTLERINGTKMAIASGSVVSESGAEMSNKGQKMTDNAGPGGYSLSCAGDRSETVLGKTQAHYAQVCNYFFALGRISLVLTAVDSTTVLAGSIARTLVSGASMADTVITGNMTKTVATGNMSSFVGTGSWSALCGSGAMSLTAGGGPVSVTSGAAVAISAASNISLTSPTTKIGVVPVGFLVAGIPGPPGPHLDYITGLPILGLPTISVG